MHSDKIAEALGDMADNIAFALELTDDFDHDRFIADRRTVYAVVRCLEIISEASRRIPDALRDLQGTIVWRDIADAGNFYRHEYRGVVPSRVWSTVVDHLPTLQVAVQALLAAGAQD